MCEHHPNDSRLKIAEDGICQTLNSRMGTGGGNVPIVLSIHECTICWTLDEKMGQTYIHEDCANTLAQRDYKQPQAVIYEIKRSDDSCLIKG